MESFLGAAAALALAAAVATALGYGLVSLLLPGLPRDLRFCAMPTTGYAVFCLVVMVVSGNGQLAVGTSVWIAAAILVALSIAAFAMRKRRAAAEGPSSADARLLALVLLPTLVLAVGPTLVQGTELYLGTVNLDFFQSMVYEEVLAKYGLPVFGHFATPAGTHSMELATRAWPDSPQARFGAVMFASLLRSLAGWSSKSALTVSMEVFALCVPLSVVFFSRVVLGFGARAAALAGALAGLSAPLTMSYLYVLVGQSSGLPVLPLLIGALFLALTQATARHIAYAAILVWALFWLYALMLPFALAPMGLFALYLLAMRRLSVRGAFAFALGIALFLLLVWGGMLGQLAGFFKGLASISGRLVGTVFFVDFLTELFFVYFLGVTTYTFSNSLVFRALGGLFPGGAAAWGLAVGVSALLIAFFAASALAWRRQEPDDSRRKAAACLLVVYVAVWAYFTFVKPYGYSAFKMAVWLQFAAIPLLAFGILRWRRARGARRTTTVLAAAAGVIVVAANVVGALDYDRMSFGTDRARGYIVNAFGMGGNPEWASLGQDVAAHVKPGESVGIGFTDAIQNDWAAYRLMGVASHSVLSHEQLPEDDAYLPDPVTGASTDTSGQKKTVAPLRYEDVRNDYFLLPSQANLNPEITEQPLPRAAWSNHTFQLQDGRTLRDFLFLGRGFYREGFAGPDEPWWQPRGASRWMREGGEFYLYQAAHPGEPYRLCFTAMVGFGYPSASRTLEFWHDGRKFDERVVTDVARIVSKPFFPKGGLDRVTVVIKERTKPFPRPLGLWNRGVPEDTRNLNLYVSSARLVLPGAPLDPAPPPRRLEGANAILSRAALFDGLSAGGWVNERASLSLVAPFDGGRLALGVMVPGNLDFPFPYRIGIVVGGREHEYLARAPGAQRIVLDIPGARSGQPVDLEIRPQVHRRIPGAFSDRNRPVVQSVLLQTVEFEPPG